MKLGHCETCDTLRTLLDAERLRYDALLEKYHSLKLAGHVAPTPRSEVKPAPPSKIEDAITEKAGSNGALRRHLNRMADRMKSQGKTDDEIVTALTTWRDPDAEDDS